MIKLKELTRKNWFCFDNNYYQVNEVFDKGVSAMGHDGSFVTSEDLQPIELTTNILEDIGFVTEDGIMYDLNYDENEECSDFRLYKIANTFVMQTDFRTIAVDYVHVLQNLMTFCGVKKEIKNIWN